MLSPGTRIGPYEVVSSLGAGGMGEVYRAHDTNLGRHVALKVLPEAVASDPERLARFEREARTLASLNHPHIAQVYGFEQGPEESGSRVLVMELVAGEDLSQRLERAGPLPLDEALPIASQIVEALEAAHEQGIIHRDLKPANIKVRADGTVKVLDFGLAKALGQGSGVSGQGSGDSADDGESPTLTTPAATEAGFILGTAAYMSPEQARGKAVDKRADIWAFGVVLFEMLTGRPLFNAETVSDTIARVLERQPDWSRLPAATPVHVRVLLMRCLTKDPRQRLRDIGEARIALSTPPPVIGAAGARPIVGQKTLTLVSTVLALALAATLVLLWLAMRPEAKPILRYSVNAPADSALSTLVRPAIALSPAGSTLVFAASTAGVSRLYVRTRDALDAKVIPGTEGGTGPVVSPDGRWVAFTANDNALRKVAIGGGAVVTLATVYEPRGVSWDTQDTITFSPQATGGVFQVSADGGEPRAITTVDAGKGERTHRWPQLLPGGRAVLFTVGAIDSADNYDNATIEAVEIGSGRRHPLVTGARFARYVRTGHLLYGRGSTVFAVPFDPDSLQVRGEARPVLENVGGDTTTGALHLSIADDGTMAYIAGAAITGTRLAWVARDGSSEPLATPESMYLDPAISPDGRRAAVAHLAGAVSTIWVYDFERRTFNRLTFGRDSAITPIWSRDGKTIYYVVGEAASARTDILRIPADGGREPQRVVTITSGDSPANTLRGTLHGVSADEKSALVAYRTTSMQGDIALVSLADGKTTPIVSTQFDEYNPQLSADERWLTYQSNETGQYEIFVRDLSPGGGRWQVSTAGGEEPRWNIRGGELFFRVGEQLMVAPIALQPSFSAGVPRILFTGVLNQMRLETNQTYAVPPKGDRLLMVRSAGPSARPREVRMVLNWFEDLASQSR